MTDQPNDHPVEEAQESAEQRVEDDLDELAEAARERDEYKDLLQRTRADFENYRKRIAKESAEAERRGMAKLVRELLPVVDNLERALATGADGGSLSEGVQLVYRELKQLLERAGVESFDPAGERFDPNLHEAVTTLGQEGTEAGLVVEVIDKGYRVDGQVLRPARVVVSE